jgi:hypothetical protein
MDAATHAPTSNNRRTFLVLAVPVGLLLSGLLVWQASHAAFSDTATNAGNSWAAGEVIITNDRASALFEAPNLAPGDGDAQCIRVTYSGTLDADVRLHGAYVDGDSGLASYLDFDVAQGTGDAPDCSDFTPGSFDAATGSLASFVTGHTNFGDGLGDWSPTPNTTRTYRFSYELPSGVSNDAQGESATASFTWEARNR